MYYLNRLSDRIRIPPAMFGSDLKDAVKAILRERYEGRIFKDLGIVLSVNEPKVDSEGLVIPGDSGAYYGVEFEALAFVPQVNEVFKAEIKEVVDFGAFASIGPFQGLLHVSQIDREKFYYDKKSKSLTSKALRRALKKGDEVIVKVSTVSLKGTSSDTKIGLTMRPEGLGRVDWIGRNPNVRAQAKKGWQEVTFEIVGSEEYAKRQSGLSRKYSLFIVVGDPEKSEIAKMVGLKVPGSYYVIKPR